MQSKAIDFRDTTIRLSGASDALDVEQHTFDYLIHCDGNRRVRERHVGGLALVGMLTIVIAFQLRSRFCRSTFGAQMKGILIESTKRKMLQMIQNTLILRLHVRQAVLTQSKLS